VDTQRTCCWKSERVKHEEMKKKEETNHLYFTFYYYSFLPYIGMITIVMNDFPWVKYALLGVLGLFALIHRE
jgi:hypothetical protein